MTWMRVPSPNVVTLKKGILIWGSQLLPITPANVIGDDRVFEPAQDHQNVPMEKGWSREKMILMTAFIVEEKDCSAIWLHNFPRI